MLNKLLYGRHVESLLYGVEYFNEISSVLCTPETCPTARVVS